MLSRLPLSLPIFVTFISYASITLASFAIEPATVHPSRPNTCFNKETSSFYEDGDSWQSSGCGLSSCMKITQPSGKSQMMISHEGCGAVGYEPPCYIEENKQAEFPDCCPEIVCPDSNENNKNFNSVEQVNNEVETGGKNKTMKGKANSLVENPKDSYEKESQNKERQWRNVDNGVGLQFLDSNEASLDNDQSEEQDVLLSRKMSPKFWYWF